jgi:hypothetical protein
LYIFIIFIYYYKYLNLTELFQWSSNNTGFWFNQVLFRQVTLYNKDSNILHVHADTETCMVYIGQWVLFKIKWVYFQRNHGGNNLCIRSNNDNVWVFCTKQAHWIVFSKC